MNENLIAKLGEIGFTEYEARVYLALLRHSPATGYQLGKESGVPRSMVYEALGRLTQRGAILALPEDQRRGVRYAPVPPTDFLARQRREFEAALDSLESDLETVASLPKRNQIWNIEGDAHILSKARVMIETAETELYLALHDPPLRALREEIEAAHHRGVAIQALLFGDEALGVGEVARHPQAETVVHGVGAGTIIMVADGKEALIGGTVEAQTAAWTGNPHLVFAAREYIWQELFTQRIGQRLGDDLLARLDPADRAVFEEALA